MQAAYDIPAAVEMVGATDCSIEKCLFSHLGEYALEIHRGSKKIRVAGNEMRDLGAGGVKIGDPKNPDNDAQATEGNEVSGNHIHDIGIVYPAAVGIWIGQSNGNTISHNEIDHTFYTGISAGWTWGYGTTAARDNLIEFNLIHDIGRGMLSDMGCIYTLGMQPGTVERNNVCHDVARYEHGYGGWGLYTDEGSSNILIENNLVYRAQDGGFHQHYGRENIVRNNIFAFGETAQIRRTRPEPHRSFAFEHNIVFWNAGPLLEGKWEDDQYRLEDNIYFRSDGKPIQFGNWSFEEWQKHGQDTHSLIANPMFVDPVHDDFRLQPNSPAAKVGFRPFDLGQAGPGKSSRQ
jgi:parallel beta-helix repeat protein